MKKLILISVLSFALLLSGCGDQGVKADINSNTNVQAGTNNSAGVEKVVTVSNGDTVKVEYVGTFPDGEEFDKSEGRGPLEFEVGAGKMIKGFDKGVVGMKLNEEKTITVAPADAYGEADSGQSVEIPVSQITADGNLSVGQTLYSSTGMPAKVTAINNGTATILIQHPLAGKTLVFKMKVVQIQKAEN